MNASRTLAVALASGGAFLLLHTCRRSVGLDPAPSTKPAMQAGVASEGAAPQPRRPPHGRSVGHQGEPERPRAARHRPELQPALAALGTAWSQLDAATLEARIGELLADPETIAVVLDELAGGSWTDDETTLAGARLLLQSALILAHSADAVPLAARRLAREVLRALPAVPAPERARLIESLAQARTDGGVVLGMRYLRELLDLRIGYPDLREEFTPLLVNLADSAEEGGSYEEFHALLVAESSDPLAVRVGLSGLLRMGGESFMPLAEELLRNASDPGLREAVLQSIAAAAGPDVAAEAIARLAAPDDYVPLLTFAGRPGSARALESAYERLVSFGDSDPEARRALVLGMQGASEQTLHTIATRDSDPGVRGQALMTWSASHGESPLALSTVRASLDSARATGDDSSAALATFAAGNLLARCSSESRAELCALMLSMATDVNEGRGARRAAFRVLQQHAPGSLPAGMAEEFE